MKRLLYRVVLAHLALCVVLWVASHQRGLIAFIQFHVPGAAFANLGGRAGSGWLYVDWNGQAPYVFGDGLRRAYVMPLTKFEAAGLNRTHWRLGTLSASRGCREFTLPIWFPTLLFGAWPIVSSYRRLSARFVTAESEGATANLSTGTA